MKKNILFISVLLVAFCQSIFAAESLDRIVATVNDAVITQTELNQTISTIKKQLAATNTPIPPAQVLNKQVLDQMINKKLKLQTAEQAGITVNDEAVTKTIAHIAEQNKLSVGELYQKVAETGVSTSEYRKDIREELMIQQLQQQEVGSKINIAPQEIESFMRSKAYQAFNTKEYHLEDILVALPDTPSSEEVTAAKDRATALLAKIRQGTPFNEVGAGESGNQNALQGGDLGWRKLAEIPSAFAEKLVHLQPNEVAGPIQTPNGFHIIRLTGLRGANQGNALEQKQQVQQLVFQRKYEEGVQIWVNRLRSAAIINTKLEA